jgi:undecaprenyl-diphosphatase
VSHRLTERPKLGFVWPFVLLSLTIVLGLAVVFDVGQGAERSVMKALAFRQGATDQRLIAAAQWITWAGDVAQRSLLMVVFAAILAWRKHIRAAIVMIVTVPLAGVASSLLKEAFGRERPDVAPHLDVVTSLSYPSGHAVNAMAVLLLGALLLGEKLRGLWVAFALIGAFIVGLSRPMLGVHWPTDVLGGWLLGAAFALAGWKVASMVERPPRAVARQAEGDVSASESF